ncbi:DUF4032 domain-containing protein [Actinobacteria bacterium YIM 96077]|uniref:DUF4032 domain-containing protein n=1 Tax=Phytoactinopolyspora halophila TaxID=1981511 RepID=A0A329R221_9ACTN|nr:DUF4032 domain-containing protein [Phytoactinopolyspora halophila]AYY11507.1 DUF4032 domain-containing protein [Actinobacteria bacterium YIM 96077]RAW18009.1 DUF4032 domain-containing protein [Phytoactinopolyspora halophila]
MELRILATPLEQQELLDLPWDMPLEEWPEWYLVALPRGISRHVVRFTRLGQQIYALKEVVQSFADREYRLLRDLERLDVPAVQAVGVVSGREAPGGEPLDAILVTRHLQFSLPYRALFARMMRRDTVERLIDALVVLVARLHLLGFYWGDCSLSNTLFRRDAGAFAAYLVDAETGELHDRLSDGQRAHDLEIARVNIAGEMMDLAASGHLDDTVDPIAIGDHVVERYEALWAELTEWESFDVNERWRIARRVERLNELGFDVAELDIVTDIGGRTVRVQPKVVDPGHHSRRLLRLTGIDAQENQARRLLNDLDAYAAETDQQGEDEAIVANAWVLDCFEPVIRGVPRELRGKLEAPEIYHEVLEHRWYLSEEAGHDVGIMEATRDYVNSVLRHKPDELAVLGGTSADPEDTQPLGIPWNDLR